MILELILVLLIIVASIYVYYVFDLSKTLNNIGNSIDSALGGTKDENYCPNNDPNRKCLKNCVDWSALKNSGDFYCNKDFGSGWVAESVGQGLCSVGTGKALCKKDPVQENKKYMKNCVVWTDIDLNGNKFCSDDHGDGWVYTGEKNQADCIQGFGKGKCKYDSEQANKKYMKNCVIWSEIDKNGNKYCSDDFGSDWRYTGQKEQAGCSTGYGKGKCEKKKEEEKKEEEKTEKLMNNCVIWNDIESYGDKYCNDDHGAGWKYAGKRGQEDCSFGFGKGKCVYDDSERYKRKTWKNCVDWVSIETYGDKYCKEDFGKSYTYNGRGAEGCAWGYGKGYCYSN